MKVMVIVKATKDSEAGILPDEKLFTEMGKFNEQMLAAGVLLSGQGLHPSSKDGYRVHFSATEKPVVEQGPFDAKNNLMSGWWIIKTKDVEEAIRLFLCSTMDAVSQGSNQGSRELHDEVNRLEAELKRRLPIGWSTSMATLQREMVAGKGYSQAALHRALLVLQRRDTIIFRNQGGQVYRNGA